MFAKWRCQKNLYANIYQTLNRHILDKYKITRYISQTDTNHNLLIFKHIITIILDIAFKYPIHNLNISQTHPRNIKDNPMTSTIPVIYVSQTYPKKMRNIKYVSYENKSNLIPDINAMIRFLQAGTSGWVWQETASSITTHSLGMVSPLQLSDIKQNIIFLESFFKLEKTKYLI